MVELATTYHTVKQHYNLEGGMHVPIDHLVENFDFFWQIHVIDRDQLCLVELGM